MSSKSHELSPHSKRKFRVALTLLADALDDAPEVLAGIRLNRFTGIIEAFDPKTQRFVECSNNISGGCDNGHSCEGKSHPNPESDRS